MHQQSVKLEQERRKKERNHSTTPQHRNFRHVGTGTAHTTDQTRTNSPPDRALRLESSALDSSELQCAVGSLRGASEPTLRLQRGRACLWRPGGRRTVGAAEVRDPSRNFTAAARRAASLGGQAGATVADGFLNKKCGRVVLGWAGVGVAASSRAAAHSQARVHRWPVRSCGPAPSGLHSMHQQSVNHEQDINDRTIHHSLSRKYCTSAGT